jgi:hypothetical protein
LLPILHNRFFQITLSLPAFNLPAIPHIIHLSCWTCFSICWSYTKLFQIPLFAKRTRSSDFPAFTSEHTFLLEKISGEQRLQYFITARKWMELFEKPLFSKPLYIIYRNKMQEWNL